MEAMKKFRDKFFELAIVDPEYGIDEGRRSSYRPWASTVYKPKNWDLGVPDESYFVELFRVSKNQIIWGGNYFSLPPMPKWIVWDKQQPEGIDQAMFELAWSSQTNKQSKIFRRSPAADNNKVANGDPRLKTVRRRIHPTQKPIALYKWLLKNYAKQGDKILDTHLGSGSSRIAAFDMGFDFWGYELDKDYFEAQEKRFKNHIAQLKLFQP
jgi:site-specific DNA-methyltransferase (adenine-specific)